jgi:hypothetical protein
LGRNAGVTQRQLKRSEPFSVFPNAFRQKDASGHHVLGQFGSASEKGEVINEIST